MAAGDQQQAARGRGVQAVEGALGGGADARLGEPLPTQQQGLREADGIQRGDDPAEQYQPHDQTVEPAGVQGAVVQIPEARSGIVISASRMFEVIDSRRGIGIAIHRTPT